MKPRSTSSWYLSLTAPLRLCVSLASCLLTLALAQAAEPEPLVQPRGTDGDGSVTISGELKQWHKVTLTIDGPFAHERDNTPNPFTDYRLMVLFEHESGSPRHDVTGYFAADGDAASSGAVAGVKWRAHLSPDKPGKWTYTVSFLRGKNARLTQPWHADERHAGWNRIASGRCHTTIRDMHII